MQFVAILCCQNIFRIFTDLALYSVRGILVKLTRIYTNEKKRLQFCVIVTTSRFNGLTTGLLVLTLLVELQYSFFISFHATDKMVKNVCSKTYVTPRRPFEKARLDQELKLIGEFGLKNKREVWRVKFALAKIRKRARDLLTLGEKDNRRLFEGNALLRRLVRIGVLDEGRMKLDYVLGLKVEDFLERRLQTQVFKLGLAKSIHHARVLIRQRHIR